MTNHPITYRKIKWQIPDWIAVMLYYYKYGYIDNVHPYVYDIYVEILDNIQILTTIRILGGVLVV